MRVNIGLMETLSWVAALRVEQRHDIRENRVPRPARKSLMLHGRMFFRNIPFFNEGIPGSRNCYGRPSGLLSSKTGSLPIRTSRRAT